MSKRDDAQEKNKRRNPGRPSILEIRKDPDLAKKAAEMRFLGHSWGEIGSSLGLSRSTARRLSLLYKKEIGCQAGEIATPSVPKRAIIGIHQQHSQHSESAIDDDVLERLPKTFQIFSSLLARVRDMDR